MTMLVTSLLAMTAAALLSAAIIPAIKPLLQRYALARPNARSSHRVPTPQGAGIAVISAALAVSGTAAVVLGFPAPVVLFGSTFFIALVGMADDIRSIPVLPRLLLQAVAVGAILFVAPADLRVIPACPLWIERAFLLLAGLWFVNLVNFMDGLDLITVAEVVPTTAAMVLLGWSGTYPSCPRWWRPRCAAPCWDLRRSIVRSQRFSSATSAACRSACCSAGACCNSPGINS